MANFYAVHKGRQTGVYATWDECQAMTKGYPGAIFKKFEDQYKAFFFMFTGLDPELNETTIYLYNYWLGYGATEEATKNVYDYIQQNQIDKTKQAPQEQTTPQTTPSEVVSEPAVKQQEQQQESLSFNGEVNQPRSIEQIVKIAKTSGYKKQIGSKYISTMQLPHEEIAYAYVDGSYKSDKTISYGVVICHNGKSYTTSGRRQVSGTQDSIRNVEGELTGAVAAVQFCEIHNIPNLILHFDYMGIGCWIIDESIKQDSIKLTPWKANHPITKSYQERVKKSNVKVYPRKVKAHSGHYYNDMADLLAGEAPMKNGKALKHNKFAELEASDFQLDTEIQFIQFD